MKRILTLVTAFVVVLTAGNYAKAQAATKGNVIIDPYYGFPNFGKFFAKNFAEEFTGLTIGGYGPAGARVEYMLADKFGIGVDAIFNGIDYKGTVTDTVGYDGMGNAVTDEKTGKVAMRRVRVQARFNYHFDVATPELDLYLGFGAGFNTRTVRYWEDDVEQTDYQVKGALFPVSFRAALGMRYYFTNNIGLNAELGIGGPVMSAGLSFKF